ncbi:hypothetical protein EPN18_07725 [bacterium]|nr:MAG: hypothetical protein EPN18_07725 [bacterium]
MPTEIKESIKVMAVFDAGAAPVKPVKFKWRGRVYPIKEITCTWRTKDGIADVVHFAVTDGATLYEISYNQLTMRWTLEEAGA